MGRQATRSRLVLVVVFAAAVAGTASAPAGASGGPFVSRGPSINRTLMGGTARDLSVEELRVVNRARGIAFPR